MKDRLLQLKQRIEYYSSFIPQLPMTIEYLYYNYPSEIVMDEESDLYIQELFNLIDKNFIID